MKTFLFKILPVGHVPSVSVLKFYALSLSPLLMLLHFQLQTTRTYSALGCQSYWNAANKKWFVPMWTYSDTNNKHKSMIYFVNLASKYCFWGVIFNFREKPFPWKCFYISLFLKGWQPRKKLATRFMMGQTT